MAPTILVTRKDNGIAEYKFTDGSKTITGSGFWDDATPWAAGSYDLSFWGYLGKSNSFRLGQKATPDLVSGRTDILLHRGRSSQLSD